MSSYPALARVLQIQEDTDSEKLSAQLTSAILSSVHDQASRLTLEEIYESVSASDGGALLDPLGVLPRILPSSSPGARDLIAYMGQHSNAREAMIALQEATERLELDMREGEDNDESDQSEKPSGSPPPSLGAPAQLVRLVDLYGCVIPRLEVRRRTPLDTLRPVLSGLDDALSLAVAHADKRQGRDIIAAVARLVGEATRWVRTKSVEHEDEIVACNKILKSLLDSTLEGYQASIDSSLAQRTFQQYFPRLVFRSATRQGWEAGEQALQAAQNASTTLGNSERSLSSEPSVVSLILLAHSPPSNVSPLTLLSTFLPTVIHCIQTSTALDETLALLLHALHRAQASDPPLTLDPSTSVPLASLLPTLASSHPDPPTRHLVFRLLSMVLALSPPLLRLQLLRDILTDTETTSPQMRVAAVGLVKEAVLQGLAQPEGTSVFASPALFQAIGPVLFRADLPRTLQLDEFVESGESARLSEVLAFYYVVFMRDSGNRTGIRDPDRIAAVQGTLLGPLRVLLDNWLTELPDTHSHDMGTMALASLETNLERVENGDPRLSMPRT
ncbi:hypothetical protein GLOTRDRAFT_116948 [Gloeophyllum trabeum ATCC 11539]|uniref:Uncharacterized protein n=1 Tax=Gloeophyllum trabeum (strain ATCC 11539 / FP-39264 / Madison 617) TaxID=670483 RepID=S7Q1X8_GLOTA|nr:uncharacterized protein GLOTRDRAFT_116948 [Gloeophyllum trabeum ATCC 11539]EPQ53522.1 hypothetical protein GLOTRDRAFT_116948 [Gloeophyllum trabeum ATCC 11539]